MVRVLAPMARHNGEKTDWIETVVRIAGRLGFNEVRLRWRLRNLPQNLGLVAPRAVSVSSLLGLLLLLCHIRQMLLRPQGGLFGAAVDVVVALGGYWLPALEAGEYWRYATAVFLHFGLLHLAFNLIALAQICPNIEDAFGRGRTLFFFMSTGVLSFAACHAWHMTAPSAGASGAVMGLIGVAAGWGQRDGSAEGRAIRNQMLDWLIYTTIYGVMMNANHIAHFAGFAVGGAFGFITPPRWLRRKPSSPIDAMLGVIGLTLALGSTWCVLRPPTTRIWIAPPALTLGD